MYINGQKRVELEIPDEDLMYQMTSKITPEQMIESTVYNMPIPPLKQNFASINDFIEEAVLGKSMGRDRLGPDSVLSKSLAKHGSP